MLPWPTHFNSCACAGLVIVASSHVGGIPLKCSICTVSIMDSYSFLDIEDENDPGSVWVTLDRTGKADIDSTFEEDSHRSAVGPMQATQPEQAEIICNLVPKNPAEASSQQTLSSRLWNIVPSFNLWGARATVEEEQTFVGECDTSTMATSSDEQKKPGFFKRKKIAATGVMQRVKGT